MNLIFAGYKLVATVYPGVVALPVKSEHLQVGGRLGLIEAVDDLIVASVGVAGTAVALITHYGGGYIESHAGRTRCLTPAVVAAYECAPCVGLGLVEVVGVGLCLGVDVEEALGT